MMEQSNVGVFTSKTQKEQLGITDSMVRAAETLLLAMAHEDLVRPIVEAYEAKILESMQAKVSEEFEQYGLKDEIILERKRAYLMSKEDHARFIEQTFIARDAAKLKVSRPENCPLLEAEHYRIRGENNLIIEMSKHPKLSNLKAANSWHLDGRKKALDLMLNLVSPFVRNADEILKSVKNEQNVVIETLCAECADVPVPADQKRCAFCDEGEGRVKN